MADKVILEAEVKSNIKGVAKDTKEWSQELKKTKQEMKGVADEGAEVVGEMQILGVSLRGLKAGWASSVKGAKFLFSTIKLGIISTGIGIFVVAFGTLASWFTKTKAGAEALKVALAAMGAAFNVIVDRIAKFGGGLAKILSGNVKAGLKDMGDSFKDIGTEILLDVSALILLEKAQQKLIDSQRKLNVETAQQRANIEELKLIAEDVTKSEEERLNAAKKAFKIENDLLDQRVANAEESVRIEKERIDTILDPGAEALDVVAQKEIDLANIRGESATKQVELNNKINAIQAEGAAKRLERTNAQAALLQEKVDEEKRQIQELIDLETERVNKLTIDAAALLDEFNNSQLEAQYQEQNAIYEKYNAIIEGKIALNESVVELEEAQQSEIFKIDEKYRKLGLAADEKAKKKQKAIDDEVTRAKIDSVTMGFSVATSLAKEGSAAAKGIAVAQTIFNTQQGIMKALADVPYPMNIVQSALTGIMGAASIAKILSTNPEGGGAGGGGGGASMSGAAPPAPQMMSGAFDLGGGIAPEATKAFVVTDEMSSSQAQLANIRRQATI